MGKLDLVGLIEEGCRRLNLTETELSQAVVGHNTLVSDMRRGRSPSVKRLEKVCEALGLEFYVGPPRELDLERAAQGINEARARWREERAQDALRNLVAKLLEEIVALRQDLGALVGRASQQPPQDAGAEEVADAGAWASATEAERQQATQRLAAIERSNALANEGKPRAEADAIAGKEAGVSASAVGAWRRRIKDIASPVARKEALLDRPRTGRPASLDASMQKTLEELATHRGRHLSAEDARQALIERHGRAPTVSTIRRWLKRWQGEYGDGRLEPGQPLPSGVETLENRDQAEAPSVGDNTDLIDRILDLAETAHRPFWRSLSDEEHERLVADIRELILQMDDEEPEESADRAADRVA